MKNEQYLLVVSGPSGIGKDTVVNDMLSRYKGIERAVSATTRPPRDYEIDGQHYFFLSKQEFETRVEAGDFVEHASYAGYYYGTLKSEVERRIAKKITCVLVIEVTGAGNIKQMYPNCTTVFISAPSEQEHERRLRSRGSESEDVMRERLRIAQLEMQLASRYDYEIINDIAQVCADELYQIIKTRQSEA